MNNNEIIKKYLKMRKKNTRPHSFAAYRLALDNFSAFLTTNQLHISNLTTENLYDFFADLRDGNYSTKKLSINSCHQRLALVKSFLTWCYELKLLNSHPDQIISKTLKQRLPKKPKTLPKPVSESFIQKMLIACPQNKSALLHFMYDTGARISEVLNVKTININFIENTVRFYQTKQDEERISEITQNTANLINYYIQHIRPNPKPGHEEYLFISKNKTRYSKRTIQRWFERFSTKLGEKITPHQMRASFATHMISNGADIKNVQLLGGWKSIATLDHYVKVSRRRQKEIFETTHPMGIHERRLNSEEQLNSKIQEVSELLDNLKASLVK